MDVAIVTGASSVLGLAVSRRLIDLGFRVYGLGGNFADIPLRNSAFVPVNCNLADPGQVEGCAREIITKERAVCLVVNNAKLYPPEDLTQATTDQLERSLAVNLLCPLILLREALPGLQRLQGQIVNIASATPETGRGGPTGAATAGALRWMGEQLFQQVRETGVKVTTISPEPNRWRPADTAPAPGQRPQSVIDPDAVAGCVADLVSNRSGNVITEIVLRPQRIVEKPQVPVRELPYPKPQPIPYTVPRAEIEAEEQLDDEREIAQERRDGRELPEDQDGDGEGERRGRRRSRRRRGKGGSARSEPRDDVQSGRQTGDKPPAKAEDRSPPRRGEDERDHPKPGARSSPPPREEKKEAAAAPAPPDGGDSSRRKRRRKPRPSSMGVRSDRPPFAPGGGSPKPSSETAQAKPQDSAPPRPAAESSASARRTEPAIPPKGGARPAPETKESAPLRETPAPKEPARERAGKKTAKKAVKKAAKKAAKKTAAKKNVAKKAAVKRPARKAAKKVPDAARD